MGSGADRISVQFVADESAACRKRKERCGCNSADRDARRLDCFSCFSGTEPYRHIEYWKINRSTASQFLKGSDVVVDWRKIDGRNDFVGTLVRVGDAVVVVHLSDFDGAIVVL